MHPLLSQYRDGVPKNFTKENCVISVLLDDIISEKRIQYSHLPIDICYHVEQDSRDICVDVVIMDFRRVVSNLINNAIEAIQNKGTVIVHLSKNAKSCNIEICDTGIGMKPNFLQKILNGVSASSKKNGNGIGLISSRELMQSWGWQLDIVSEHNVGTAIHISIPLTASLLADTKIVAQPVNQLQRPDLILIDDNKIITDAWQLSAIHNRKKIVIFNKLSDVEQAIDNFDFTTLIYIDSDLSDIIRGEQYAKKLFEKGFTNIYLMTGYAASFFAPMSWIKGVVGKDAIWI